MSVPSRHPAGTPTGGQFAASARTEADVDLVSAASDDAASNEYTHIGFTADNGKKWAANGFAPHRAMGWACEGFNPSVAREWTELGVHDPKVAREWCYGGPGTTSPERAQPWIEAGFGDDDIDCADGWASCGFDGRAAGWWRAAGFDVVEHGAAADWRKAGYEAGETISLRAEGFHPSMMSPTLHRTGQAPFKIKDSTNGAVYMIRAISDPSFADGRGCPGATHEMVGEHEVRLGRLEPVTGKRVAVPGWTKARKGVAADFVCDQDPDFEPLRGYLGE